MRDYSAEDGVVEPSTTARPLRLWPGLLILAAIPLLMFVPGVLIPRTMTHFIAFFLAPIVGTLGILIWWAFAARVRGRDRWLFPLLILGPVVALTAVLFPTTPQAVPVYAMPIVVGVWVICACGMA